MRKMQKKSRLTRKLSLENLENRELLAGNVAVSVRGGWVTITGDDNANLITLYQQANGTFTLSGEDGEVFSGPTTNLLIRNLTVNLKGGDDAIAVVAQPDPEVEERVPAQILGTTMINGGTGDDSMTVDVVGRLAGALVIPALAVNIDGGYELADSVDRLDMANSAAASITINTWNGVDAVLLGNVYAITLTANLGVASSFGGRDFDILRALNVSAVTGTFDTGMSPGTIDPFASDFFFDGSLFGTLNIYGSATADLINITDTLVGSALNISTYGGNDQVYLDGVQTGMTQADYQAVALQLADAFGLDLARLPFNVFALTSVLPTLPGVLNVNTGAGDDYVILLDTISTFAIYVFLDQGDDDLRVTDVTAPYSYYFGGLGTDARLLTRVDGFSLDLQFEDSLPPFPEDQA